MPLVVAGSNKEDEPESGPSDRGTTGPQEFSECPVADEDAVLGPSGIGRSY